jgi:phosphatidate cytidylyltransferase
MKTRVISALIAASVLVGLFVEFRAQGLRCFCAFCAIMAILEFARLTIRRLGSPKHIEWSFVILATILFYLTAGGLTGSSFYGRMDIAYTFAAVAAVILTTLILLTVRTSEDLPVVLQTQAFAVMGLFYCGVFTGMVTRLLVFESGQIWFLGFLAIVFSGDTFAFFAGRTFGQKKLLEPVSPKKTIAGSVGGLAGSSLAGLVMALLFFKQIPAYEIVLMALITGAFAQTGDLFESLLKRVADVKDSGRVMPGHGGILDRLDGVLFAAPVYFALVSYLT